MSFFDLFDQPRFDYSLPPDHHHHPHHHPSRYSSSSHPSQYPLTRPYHPDPSPPLDPHPLRHHRRRQLERNGLPQYHPRRDSFSRPTPHPLDSLRAERARRLAEAKSLQEARSDAQTPVELTLPDGRHCIVPLSWARRIQSKYPTILTNSMIRPLESSQPPSPPLRLDPAPLNDPDPSGDFFLLDPTQDPSIPVLSYPSPPTAPARPGSPEPRTPKHSPEERDAAARSIQQRFRTYRSLKSLDELESKFQELKAGFTYPSPLDLTFSNPPSHDVPQPISTKLAFNNPINRPVLAFEESLTLLQIKADAIVSRGNSKVKGWRKRLIKDIDSQLDQLERFKTEAWNTQRQAVLGASDSIDRPASDDSQSMMVVDDPQSRGAPEESTASAKPLVDEMMNVEMMNADAASVSSDHLSVDSVTPATPLKVSELVQRPVDQSDDLIIPVLQPDRSSSEDLVIPTSTDSKSSRLSDSILQSHPPPPETIRTPNHSRCVINPLVTDEGDLICAAPPVQPCDDILVSPV